MKVDVVPVRSKAELNAFIMFPYKLHADDPYWVPPLISDQKKMHSPGYPFFDHGRAQRFLAKRDGEVVGRISAHVNHTHLEVNDDQRGFFGWFECIDDKDVAQALFDTARDWLREQPETLSHMRGPISWDINTEGLGVLVEDREPGPPCALMAYNPKYYPKLYQDCGLDNVKDIYAYTVHQDTEGDAQLQRMVKMVKRRMPNMEARAIDLGKGYQQDMAHVRELYNDAWRSNWGSVPLSEAEMKLITDGLKPLIRPELARIGFIDGKPAGCVVCAPDINRILINLKGRLLPFGWYKLLRGAKKLDSMRTIILGVAHEYRGRGVEVLLLADIFNLGREIGIQRSEMSWVLEENQPMNALAEKLGGERYRTYRLYERELASSIRNSLPRLS